MLLGEFVAETLKQIIEGVRDAQEHASQVGAAINPRETHVSGRSRVTVQRVAFDVALTSTEREGGGGSVGIFLGPVRIGAEGQVETSGEQVNRVSFSVPVRLPVQE